MHRRAINIVVLITLILLVAIISVSVAEVHIPLYEPAYTKIPHPSYPQPKKGGLDATIIFAGFIYALLLVAIIGVILSKKKNLAENAFKEIIIGLATFFITLLIFLGLLYLGNRLRWSDTGSAIYEHSSWSVIYFYAALTFFIFLIVYVIIKSVRFEGRNEPEKITVKREYVDRAIYHLKLGTDVRSAILRAYKEMESMIVKRGVEDRYYYTPREFKDEILAELNLSEKPVESLTNLFERARYSTESMSEEDRAEAIRCLEMIRDEITP